MTGMALGRWSAARLVAAVSMCAIAAQAGVTLTDGGWRSDAVPSNSTAMAVLPDGRIAFVGGVAGYGARVTVCSPPVAPSLPVGTFPLVLEQIDLIDVFGAFWAAALDSSPALSSGRTFVIAYIDRHSLTLTASAAALFPDATLSKLQESRFTLGLPAQQAFPTCASGGVGFVCAVVPPAASGASLTTMHMVMAFPTGHDANGVVMMEVVPLISATIYFAESDVLLLSLRVLSADYSSLQVALLALLDYGLPCMLGPYDVETLYGSMPRELQYQSYAGRSQVRSGLAAA